LRQIRAEARGKAICLLIDDVDPYRISAPALASRLSEDEVRLWEAGLTGAWETLTRFHDTIAEEVISAVRVLTPLVPHADGQISATSRETFGCVGLSLAAEPLPLAASLAHEIQHAKLFALIDAVKLTYPDDGSRYYAPWRDDARPISGLLQGAYAYLGVAGFWRRQRQIEKGNNAIMAHAEFGRWRAAVQAVTRTLLNSGRLTPAGERFVARMAGVIGRWCGEPVPAVAMEAAHAAAQRHKEHWRRASGRGA
jgi:HEXXH motif-containing protein